MTTPDLAPRGTFGGVIAVWVVALLAGVGVEIFLPLAWRGPGLVLALAGCLVLAFAVQLGYGRAQRFIARVAMSVIGALLVLGLLSAGFGIAGLVPA